ncbi:ABC transporter permease subunit [Clostridiaceae bacterium M8S5]|nr:ABC transporter permease subunit [Clostridiaceae bacterium M8S5]
MNIYKYELKTYLKENIIWTISLLACLFLFLSTFNSFAAEAETLERMFENFPDVFKKAFGLGSINLSEFNSFYSMIFLYIKLISAIFAMKLGLDVISKEVREKAVEFLITKPVKRVKVVTYKLIAVFTHIIFMNLIFLLVSLISTRIFGKGDINYRVFLLITLSMFFIQMFFFSLGIFIGSWLKKIKSVIAIAMGTVFGLYILQLLNNTLQDAKLAYISPFGYFDTDTIILSEAYSSKFVIINFTLIIVFFILTYVKYQKKDFPSI